MAKSSAVNTLLVAVLVPLAVGFAPSIDLPTTTQEPTSTTPDPDTLPYFPDRTNKSSLTVPVGRAAVLPCRVLRLKDRVVSWVKKDQDKVHLITFGTNTYVSSSRFSLFHDNPDTWELGITPVQEHDAGEYVCQVSVHPPVGYTVTLRVTVPTLKVYDERNTPIQEKFYEVGSSIDLQCVAMSLAPDVQPVWSKSGLSPPSGTLSSGNASEYDPKLASAGASEGSSVTWIRIASASKNDSGNYSCTAPDASPASVRVYVLEGEDSVAMQHSTNTGGVVAPDHIQQTVFLVLLLAVPSILGITSSELQPSQFLMSLVVPLMQWYNVAKTVEANYDKSSLRESQPILETTCSLPAERADKIYSSTSQGYNGNFVELSLISFFVRINSLTSLVAIDEICRLLRIVIQKIRQTVETFYDSRSIASILSNLRKNAFNIRLLLLDNLCEGIEILTENDILSETNRESKNISLRHLLLNNLKNTPSTFSTECS